MAFSVFSTLGYQWKSAPLVIAVYESLNRRQDEKINLNIKKSNLEKGSTMQKMFDSWTTIKKHKTRDAR